MRTESVRICGTLENMSAERLLRLLSMFTARRHWGGDELADRLGVTPRTVRRDVDRLRELGYQIHAVPGPAGGYELGGGSATPPLLLDDDAAVAMALGLRAVAAGAVAGGAVAGMAEAAGRAAAVVERVLPGRLTRRVDALHSAVVPLRPPPVGDTEVSPETLSVIALACRDGERLRFGYTDGRGRVTRRHVEPYRLVFTARRWYLVAHDVDKREWRSFRLDRLDQGPGNDAADRAAGHADGRHRGGPQRTGVRSAPPDPPDAARFVAEGIASGGYRHQARVRIAAPAPVVAALVPPEAAVIEAIDDTSCLLISGSDYLDAIAMHLALLDLPFTPLEPPELADRCTVLARRLTDAAAAARTPAVTASAEP
jgi:predicted DNA-binding transcriptional regulator YafY